LVTKEAICEYLGGISGATYDKWAARGLVPGPVPGTNRYDVPQHDLILDTKLGLQRSQMPKSALEAWELAREQTS
jgi:hypothetical protein